MPVAEVDTAYGVRPEGSQSKLNTWRDGWRILTTIVKLFKAERPLLFFSIGFLFSAALSIVLAVPLLQTYLETGLVPRFPTAILCVALMLLGFLLLACGLILDTVTRGRVESSIWPISPNRAWQRLHPDMRRSGRDAGKCSNSESDAPPTPARLGGSSLRFPFSAA